MCVIHQTKGFGQACVSRMKHAGNILHLQDNTALSKVTFSHSSTKHDVIFLKEEKVITMWSQNFLQMCLESLIIKSTTLPSVMRQL